MKFVAVLLINTTEALHVMKALVDLSAQPENPSMARRLPKRLAKALAATKALVDAEPLTLEIGGAAPCRNGESAAPEQRDALRRLLDRCAPSQAAISF